MNIQEYISSGIVEAYVLGLADKAERSAFEQFCEQYPEVLEARISFELLLEAQAKSDALEPPAFLKGQIYAALKENDPFRKDTSDTTINAEDTIIEGKKKANYSTVPRIGTWRQARFISAAAVIFLCISIALNFYLFWRYKQYSVQYHALAARQSEIAQRNEALQTRLLVYERATEMMENPDITIVKMLAVPSAPAPDISSMVYWDSISNDVYLAANNLPLPQADKQYQLWAIVEGKPVDAGIFEISGDTPVIKMKSISGAEAFAITLERKGGSPTPSLDQMYVMGKP